MKESNDWMLLPLQITINPVVKGVGGLFWKQDVSGSVHGCEWAAVWVSWSRWRQFVSAPFPTQTLDLHWGAAIPPSIMQQIPWLALAESQHLGTGVSAQKKSFK